MLENQWCLKREKRQAGDGLKTKVNCESILKKQIYPMTKSVWFIEEEFIFVHFRAAESYKLIISNFLFTQKPIETLGFALFWSPPPLNILKDHKAKQSTTSTESSCSDTFHCFYLSVSLSLCVIISIFSVTNYTSSKVTQRPVVLLHWLHLTTDLTPGRWTGPEVEWTASPLASLDHKFHLTVSPVSCCVVVRFHSFKPGKAQSSITETSTCCLWKD